MKQSRMIKSLNETYEHEHFVEFFTNDKDLLDNIRRFVGGGMTNGDACIIIATNEHIESLKQLLYKSDVDVPAAQILGRIQFFDANETMKKFMKGNLPDKQLFYDTVGAVLRSASSKGKSIRAYGEMVALLWADGNQAGAVLLEQLWNNISRDYKLTLFCAYPAHHFESAAHLTMLDHISSLHSSSIIPKYHPANNRNFLPGETPL